MNSKEYISISGFENYSISKKGIVINNKTNRIMKQRSDKYGYQVIKLYREKKQYTLKIHRLVAEAFLEKIDGKNIVDHIDEDKTNNNVDNLRWCTHKENSEFYILNNPHKFKKKKLKESSKKKQERLLMHSKEMSQKYGKKISVNDIVFGSVRSAAKYIKDREPDRGKYETIRKELQKVATGKIKPYTMYKKYKIEKV